MHVEPDVAIGANSYTVLALFIRSYIQVPEFTNPLLLVTTLMAPPLSQPGVSIDFGLTTPISV